MTKSGMDLAVVCLVRLGRDASHRLIGVPRGKIHRLFPCVY